VSGQSLSAPVVVRTRAPLVPTLTFDTAPNGTHRFLMMSGGEYGPGLSTCPGDVVVTVGNKPCITASMEKVGWVWILWVCALVGGWCGVVWCGVVWSGVVWFGVVWCGVVWFGVVWCGLVWRSAHPDAVRVVRVYSL
jgi:hypothetical protein